MTAIIDYGVGNLGSIENMVKRVGGEPYVVHNPEELDSAKRMILPGVGKHDAGVNGLKATGFDLKIRELVDEGVPLLGICLGMQLLMEESEEGRLNGLGLIKGRVEKFKDRENLKIPHMGWNYIRLMREDEFVRELPDPSKFYFAHSYYAVPNDPQNVLMTCEYGEQFAAGICRGRVYGVQFHPEKSHKYGMRLIGNFLKI